MKKTRLLTAFLAAALLAGALSGCGAKKEDTRGSVAATESAREEVNPTGSVASSAAEETKEAADTEEAEAEAEVAAEAEEELEIGTTTSTSYTNEFFDIKLELDDAEWYFATEEEIAQVNATIQEMAAQNASDTELGDAIAGALEDGATYQDMLVYYADGSANMNVTIGKLTFMEAVSAKRGDFIDQMIATGGEELTNTYESVYGMEDVTVEAGETVFCGETVPCMITKAKAQGMQIYMKQVYIVKGTYNAILTATTYLEDYTDDMIALFEHV